LIAAIYKEKKLLWIWTKHDIIIFAICVMNSMDLTIELRGFAPIGMLELWNNGLWGIDGMGYWENQVENP
jgi:hypothetical protein